MTVMTVRLFIIYFFTLSAARLMGKRQIGQLQLSELVSAFFLSEIATYCVTDPSLPLSRAALPIAAVICAEIGISFLSLKSVRIKRFFDGKPSYLIKRGKIMIRQLEKNRITLGELMSELRQNGAADPGQVDYAVLESNGKISVILKERYSPLTAEDLGIAKAERGLCHTVIADGRTDKETLKLLGKDENWLKKTLREHGIGGADRVLILTVDDLDGIFCVKKERS